MHGMVHPGPNGGLCGRLYTQQYEPVVSVV